jgi:Domain of unknown function (DUF4436)
MSNENETNWLTHPGPRKISLRLWGGILVALLVLASLWTLSQAVFSEQPKSIKPAEITSAEGLQATVRASSFNSSNGQLSIQMRLKAIGDLADSRSILRKDITLRVVDDLGVTMLSEKAGDPLSTEEVVLQTDGDVNQYPYDTYKGSFSLVAERVGTDGSLVPIALSVGTAHAETGWFTRYNVTRGNGTEAKITIVSMGREPFAIAFATILALLMLILACIGVLVGFLTITNRRPSDPPLVGWLVGLLFALPFIRRLMPGDPPIGCALDVQIFSWALILNTLAILLAMVAWLRQSKARLQVK